MSSFLDDLEHDLVTAARRRRPNLRSLLLATGLFVTVGATAAGGTMYALQGSVIPAPAARDVPPDQLPVAGSSRLVTLRAPDPDAGEPPWALRVARSRTGLLCTTVGQVVDGRFGLVGLDGRFRALPERIVDGCGEPRSGRASLVGARVLDARRPEDVRTVVNGVAGPELHAVTVVAGGRARRLPIARGGAFVAALPGYPEDAGLRVALEFEDGRVERHPFGTSPFVVADPAGGRAWQTEASSMGGSAGTCIGFRPARETRRPAISPAACGRLGDPRRRTGYFFAVRRIEPGTGGVPFDPFGNGNWGDHPPRTAVWGAAGEDVEAVEVLGPDGVLATPAVNPSRAFLAVFPPDVDPSALRVRLRLTDGSVRDHRGDTRLRPLDEDSG